MIEIESLSYQIAGHPILSDVSLSLKKGGIVALVGPNGAGKSTLLSLVARLRALQQGQVRVNGLKVGQVSDYQLAQVLALLPQELNVTSRLTVRDLVAFGRYPYHKGRPGAEDTAFIETALRLFELEDLAEQQLDTLSGGQKQRAFVVMAYAQDTDYLLLDEPRNNLDIAASRALMARLQELARDRGRTVVIVLHDITCAAAYADRIIALKTGQVVAVGAPDQIVTDTFLRDVFGTGAGVSFVDGRPVVLV